MNSFIREKWFTIDSKLKYDLKVYSDVEKRKNEETTDIFVKKVNEYIKRKPRNKNDERLWELEGEKIFEDFIKNDRVFNLNYFTHDMQKSIIDVTKNFIKKAKEFDKDIEENCIVQALRNIWVITILQVIFKSNVELTKSIFAYSMIYPYSDNFLDNIDISVEAKNKFNNKISSMLKGRGVQCESYLEKKIYKLLKYIEEDYNRKDFKEVYEGLLKIQEGQIKSIEQQGEFSLPYVNDILGISIEKGGASVLVDGYLIKGKLNLEEEKFCLFYGFLLQLIDDFQDLKSDKKNNHTTIMSQLGGRYYMDEMINKLINYVYYVFDSTELLREKEDLNKVIKSDSLVLILCSIALNKEYFSKEYIKKMDKHLPFSIAYIEKLNKTLVRKISKVEGVL